MPYARRTIRRVARPVRVFRTRNRIRRLPFRRRVPLSNSRRIRRR